MISIPPNLPPVTTNRFQGLLSALPKGAFYDATGFIIPFSSSPQQFRFETTTSLRTFGVFVNDIFAGTVVSDAHGIVIVTVQLRPGKNTIRILDAVTQQPFISYVDARHIATWYASYTDTIEVMDAEGEDIYNARSLDTVSSNYAELVYGLPLSTPNVAGYTNVSYVNVLQELRQSYRGYGGMPRGLRAGVGAFLSSAPVDISDDWIPEWDLGFDLLPNGNLQQLSRSSIAQESLAGVDLPNINAVSRTWIVASILDTGVSTYAPAHQPPIPQILTLTTGGAWAGGTITINGFDATGTSISETLTPVLNQTIATTFLFASVTNVVKSVTGGVGSAVTIGVGVSRYVTIQNIGGLNRIGSAIALVWHNTPSLQWSGGNVYSINNTVNPSGVYVLTGDDLDAEFDGVPVSTFNLDPLGLGADTSGHFDQIYITKNRNPITLLDLSALAPATAVTAASIAALSPADISTITGNQGVNGTVMRIQEFGSDGPHSEVGFYPGGADAARIVFGYPQSHTTLSAGASPGAMSITVVSGAVFPSVPPSPLLAKFQLVSPKILGVSLGVPSVSTTPGVGALKLIISSSTNKTLAYESPGDSFGTAVQVGAGGTFTLVSNNGTDTLAVTVNPAVLNASTQSQTITDSIVLYTPGQFQIAIRGRRAGNTDGQITAIGSGVTATFTSAGTTFTSSDLGGGIRVVSANTGNQGGVVGHNLVHPIIAVTGAHTVTIMNAGAPGTIFTSEAGDTFSLFSPDELHTVTKVAGNVLSLQEPIVSAWPGNVGVYVDRADEVPPENLGLTGPDTLTVLVDPTFVPTGGPLTDNITPVGSYVPDGWHTTGVTSSTTQVPGSIEPGVLVLESTAVSDVTLFHRVPNALAYIGLPLKTSFWVMEHSAASANYRIDVSLDGASTWQLGTPVSVSGLVKHISGGGIATGPQQYTPVRRTFFVPTTATDVWVRLVRVSAGENPLTFTVGRAMVESLTHTALSTGVNTVPRSNQRANFRELIYLWSPEPLLASEDAIIGVNPGNVPPFVTKPGHVDLLMPAHESVDRFDVSEYDGNNLPINIVGVYTDADWATNATLTNMEIVVGTPARLTYSRPTRVSRILAETLAFTTGVGGQDSLPLSQPVAFFGSIPPGTPDGAATLMAFAPDYEQLVNGVTIQTPVNPGDIVVVPDTVDASSVQPWKWIVGNSLFIDNSYFDSSATYHIDYNALIRAETGAIQLNNSTMSNYAWLIDVAYYTRVDLVEGLEARSEQAVFRADYTATLGSHSNQDLSTSTLIADNGLTRTTVAQANWSYLNGTTIRINPSVFDPNSIYTISYESIFPQLTPPANVLIEWRSASSQFGLTSATYAPVQNGEAVNPVDVNGTYNQFHQIRVTISDVVDVRDARIYGIGLKGIHLYGSPPSAPGLIVS